MCSQKKTMSYNVYSLERSFLLNHITRMFFPIILWIYMALLNSALCSIIYVTNPQHFGCFKFLFVITYNASVHIYVYIYIFVSFCEYNSKISKYVIVAERVLTLINRAKLLFSLCFYFLYMKVPASSHFVKLFNICKLLCIY